MSSLATKQRIFFVVSDYRCHVRLTALSHPKQSFPGCDPHCTPSCSTDRHFGHAIFIIMLRRLRRRHTALINLFPFDIDASKAPPAESIRPLGSASSHSCLSMSFNTRVTVQVHCVRQVTWHLVFAYEVHPRDFAQGFLGHRVPSRDPQVYVQVFPVCVSICPRHTFVALLELSVLFGGLRIHSCGAASVSYAPAAPHQPTCSRKPSAPFGPLRVPCQTAPFPGHVLGLDVPTFAF